MLGLRHYLNKYNLSAAESLPAALVLTLPLLLLPVLNLIPLMFSGHSAVLPLRFKGLLISLFWVCVEEIIFRGIIPVAAGEHLKLSAIQSAAAASALFALFHFAGIVKGTEFSYVAVQALLAFGAGFSFSSLVYRCGSIFPGTAVHFLLNLTADICGDNALPNALWICAAALCVVYGIYLFRSTKENSP